MTGSLQDAAHRPIGTRLEFHDALRAAFKELAHKGCREVFLSDETFADAG